MGATKQIPRSDWQRYFDELTKRHLHGDPPKAASIELVSLELGDQPEATLVRLTDLDYDPKSEALEVMLEDVDHLVFHPAEIWVVEEEDGFISALAVVHTDGSKEIMRVQVSGLPAPIYRPV